MSKGPSSCQPFTVLVLAANLLWLEGCPLPGDGVYHTVTIRKAWGAGGGCPGVDGRAAVEEPCEADARTAGIYHTTAGMMTGT